mgnify:CR=1 FL=1
MEQDNLGEVEITATYEQWKDFLASAIWHDMKTEIGQWVEVIRSSLGSDDEPRELFRMQGRLEACENVLELPDNMLSILEDRHKKFESIESELDSYTSHGILDSIV